MKEINFISSGMMGDFIHVLSVVKNICEKENAIANVYITDNVSLYGFDRWRYGVDKAYSDLWELVSSQDYINEFRIIKGDFVGDYINLNDFRKGLVPPFKTWTKLLCSAFNLDVPLNYDWISVYAQKNKKIVFHCSERRWNPNFDWDFLHRSLMGFEKTFITFSEDEFKNFPLSKYGTIQLKLVSTMKEMATEIASGLYFIGNQSTPFALASALDVPRLVILDQEPAPFYMGEQEFSSNISWYLNDEVKYKAGGSIVSI